MKLIDVTCPKCKAIMKVDELKKEIKCEYCGNMFLIDEEVLKVKHLNAGEIDENQEYKNAITYLNFKDYNNAYNCYLSLSKRYVDNPVVWIGLLRSITYDFTKREYNSLYVNYWNNYCSLVSENEILKYKDIYQKYIDSFNEYDKIDSINKVSNGKDYIYATVLGGMFGIHKFMRREYGKGFLYLFTFGLFMIGWIWDSITEIKKHPECKNKTYNCLGILAILCGISYINYSPFGALLIVLSGILTITPISRKIWKKPTKYSKVVKLLLLIIGFIIVVVNSPSYLGEYKSDNMSVIISMNDIKIKENNGSYESFKYEIEYRKDFILIKPHDSLHTFRYRESKNDLCLYKDNGCVFYLKK